MTQTFSARGKLLISGEYAVIDGALALAVPTKLGQKLCVEYSKERSEYPSLEWKALLFNKDRWFEAKFDLKTLEIRKSNDTGLAEKLKKILKAVESLTPGFFTKKAQNIQCTTFLEFPKNWGLGSSSTLVSLLSQWTKVDAFELNRLTFNTSGYDVACATEEKPIFYQVQNENRKVEETQFFPKIRKHLYFVHLNQKQDTQTSVQKHYNPNSRNKDWLNAVSALSYNLCQVENLEEFENIVTLHEDLIASKIGLPKVKDLYFFDYEGVVKSLGAWGGDFVLVTARKGFKDYFKNKGFATILSYEEMFG